MNKQSEAKSINLEATVGLPVVKSAGALVCNSDHHILLIFKRGKWDLPKGRVDNNESNYPETALREVHEETGLALNRLSTVGKLVSTWHTTAHAGRRVLKKTHWYLMTYNGHDDDVEPQIEEGIIECRWIHVSDLKVYQEAIQARINYVIDFWHKNLAYTPRA